MYDPTRFEFGASKSDLVSHNKHAMTHLFEGRVRDQPDLDLSGLGPGEATVGEDRDDPVAVYRDEDGAVHAVSAVCPHMGCLVSWNDGERSWDCPCHGSRFDVDGSVLDTPAVDDLDPVEVGSGAVDLDSAGRTAHGTGNAIDPCGRRVSKTCELRSAKKCEPTHGTG